MGLGGGGWNGTWELEVALRVAQGRIETKA